MARNIDKFKDDINKLKKRGELLKISMLVGTMSKEDLSKFKNGLGEQANEGMKSLPDFSSEYQAWYSEALVLLRRFL